MVRLAKVINTRLLERGTHSVHAGWRPHSCQILPTESCSSRTADDSSTVPILEWQSHSPVPACGYQCSGSKTQSRITPGVGTEEECALMPARCRGCTSSITPRREGF